MDTIFIDKTFDKASTTIDRLLENVPMLARHPRLD
jgi:hypothetical protein